MGTPVAPTLFTAIAIAIFFIVVFGAMVVLLKADKSDSGDASEDESPDVQAQAGGGRAVRR